MLGVLSLVFWSLTIVISVKYLVYVMRADNRGEGGILALMALASSARRGGRIGAATVLFGLFGAALLYGDGMITPAISVLSAVEGVGVAAPGLGHFVEPITVAILVGLFAFQKRGTAGVGKVFGPVTLVWFVALAALGSRQLLIRPEVLWGLSPHYAVVFLVHNHVHGFLVLGAVFLVVTGGEALYADMGHFGLRPIRATWFAVALPALLLNYFGQGALLLSHPEAASNPFYRMAPVWAVVPLIVLSTAATIIASQAVISGAFSLTRQASMLGFWPRVQIQHTSAQEIGQIYVPTINWLLMVASIGLVLGFRIIVQPRGGVRHRGYDDHGDHHVARVHRCALPLGLAVSLGCEPERNLPGARPRVLWCQYREDRPRRLVSDPRGCGGAPVDDDLEEGPRTTR